MEIIVSVLLLAVGFVMLVKGADWFVDGASGIAGRFGIPELVIGLTIVAMGTSLPEAAVSITSAIGGSAGITIGNVLGSNILNILIILGITSVIVAVPVQKSTVNIEIPFMILVSCALLAFGGLDGKVTRIEGVILWLLFLVYLVYLFQMAKNNKEEQEEHTEKRALWLQILMLVGGAAIIVFGSDIAVDAATAIATYLGVSERFIGLTIVALGTSLPELVTSVVAAKKGSVDIAIGNIVGSCLFNILFVTGTTALITDVAFQSGFIIDSLVAIGAAVLLWLCVRFDQKLTRLGGIVMLASYAVYFCYLCMK